MLKLFRKLLSVKINTDKNRKTLISNLDISLSISDGKFSEKKNGKKNRGNFEKIANI